MSTPAAKQIAFCWLLFKGGHWVPVSPSRKLTAADRSSADGPVIMAEIHADVEGAEVVRWRRIGSVYRDVDPNGVVQPLDVRLAVSTVTAPLMDALLRSRGVIGIYQALAERKQAAQERKIPSQLHSAFARAAIQIRDRLHGQRAIGVVLRSAQEAVVDQGQA